MSIDKGAMIVCLAVGLVILFNIGLAVSLLNPATRDQVRMLGAAFKGIRNPWKDEDEALANLHARVQALKGDQERAEGVDET